MITVVYDGNLGNNLFQYVFGRLLAERLGLALEADPISGIPATGDAVEGEVYKGEPLVLRSQKPDLAVLQAHPRQPILLTGYFQRAEYYTPYRDRIRKWLTMDIDCGPAPGANDLVVGVRRGQDYIPRHGIPLSYYDRAIEHVDHDQLHICSDSSDDPFIKTLASKYGGIVRAPGALDNLRFITQFRQMVISNSSFLWWAAFLSDADPVIYPRPANGFWSRNDPLSRNIELEVDDRRYCYLDCDPYVSEFPLEIARIRYDGAKNAVKDFVRPLLWFKKPVAPSSPYRFREED